MGVSPMHLFFTAEKTWARRPCYARERMGFFSKTLDKLKGALKKTTEVLKTDVRTLFIPGRQIDDAFLIETEEKLIRADMGVANVTKIIGEIRVRWRLGKIRNQEEAGQIFRDELLRGWGDASTREIKFAPAGTPTVVMVCGVNGAGKTTSIAKLAALFKERMAKKVMVAASDTFRAAAV